MPIVYKTCGEGIIPEHLCNACIEVEQGGVRGVAFILSDYIPRDENGLIDGDSVESLAWWNTGITTGKIIVIPKTSGTFDGGAAVTGQGYGDVKEIVTGKTFTLVMNDPDHKENEPFYSSIANAPGTYHIAWRTGSELRISDKPVNIDPVDNTEEDINSAVRWTATSVWTQSRKTVQIFDLDPVKQIFNCFEVEPDGD
jgi:hypothetical protein